MSDLFPLPLSPFERYMLADHRPKYPMHMTFQFDFAGSVEREALETSLRAALLRHPLLAARVERKQWWPIDGDCDLEHVLTWLPPCDQPFTNMSDSPDLSRGIGLRIVAEADSQSLRLAFRVHHACCDGAGFLRFFGDWLGGFVALQNGQSVESNWRKLDRELLLERGLPRWPPPPEPITRWQALRGTFVEAARWLTRRPTVLAAPPKKGSDKEELLLAHQLTEEESENYRRCARDLDASENDALLRDFFVVLEQWQRKHGGSPRSWLQVNMPTDLRRREDTHMPAANVVGYAFLSRRAEACTASSELLKGLTHDTRAIRAWGLGQHFLDGLTWASKVPGMIPVFSARGSCYATAILSNLGNLRRHFRLRNGLGADGVFGPLRLLRAAATPPLRPGTRAAFLALRHGAQLTLVARFDEQHFSREAAEQLFSNYLSQVRAAVPADATNQM